jgi:hypothetical protein
MHRCIRPVIVGIVILLVVSSVTVPTAVAAGDGGSAADARTDSSPAIEPGIETGTGSLIVVGPRVEAGGLTAGVLVEADSVRHAFLAAQKPANNSTVAVETSVAPTQAPGDGDLVVDCTGGVAQFNCDKHGNLTLGVLAVGYDGTNRINLPGLAGGGGDNITISGVNRSVTVVDLNFAASTHRIVDTSVVVLEFHSSENKSDAPAGSEGQVRTPNHGEAANRSSAPPGSEGQARTPNHGAGETEDE